MFTVGYKHEYEKLGVGKSSSRNAELPSLGTVAATNYSSIDEYPAKSSTRSLMLMSVALGDALSKQASL